MSTRDATATGSPVLEGIAAGLPAMVASAPFALLFGALALDNGMTAFEAVFMSMTVFAGASQLVGLELFGQDLPGWLVVLSVFAVNFRHVLYSAALGRQLTHWPESTKAWTFFFLTDPNFANSAQRIERGQPVTVVWFIATSLTIYIGWVTATFIGAEFGRRFMPDSHAFGIDFILPIYFFGLVMGFRKRPRWLPVVLVSALASIVAFNVVGSPWHVSIGAIAGIALAALLPVQRRDEVLLEEEAASQ